MKYLVLVAGGKGKRMGGDIAKQFIELGGKAILLHTMECFARYDAAINIILVLPETDIKYWESYCDSRNDVPEHRIVCGGKERFYSVKNGVAACGDNGLIAIHDGVRPLVSKSTITRCFDMAKKKGNAIPVIAPSESVRQMGSDSSSKALDRSTIKLVQTPQVFNAALIHKAYKCDYSEDFTDDATVVESLGKKIHLVEGNRENIKITTPEDLTYALTLMG